MSKHTVHAHKRIDYLLILVFSQKTVLITKVTPPPLPKDDYLINPISGVDKFDKEIKLFCRGWENKSRKQAAVHFTCAAYAGEVIS